MVFENFIQINHLDELVLERTRILDNTFSFSSSFSYKSSIQSSKFSRMERLLCTVVKFAINLQVLKILLYYLSALLRKLTALKDRVFPEEFSEYLTSVCALQDQCDQVGRIDN